MEDRENSRVVFYSKTDMSAVWNLQNAQKVLDGVDLNQDFGLNDFLEFYNIKKYFDSGIFLNKWTDSEKENYIKLSEELWKKCALFFQNIDSQNISIYVTELSFNYHRNFWELIDRFKVYNKILSKDFVSILSNQPYHINNILKHKKIVTNFNQEIRDFLLYYQKAGEILLDFAKKNGSGFPENLLSHEDKESIIVSYIKGSEETLVSLEVIPKLQDGFLRISSKTKLLAKKKHEEKVKEFFDGNSNVFKYGCSVGFSPEQKEPIKVEQSQEGLPSITYSIQFLNSFGFKENPLNIFVSVFGFISNVGLIDLRSKESDIDSMELLFSHWENFDYKESSNFRNNQIRAILNLQILQTYLKEYRDSSIESIINTFISRKLKEITNVENFDFSLDAYDISYEDKIKVLFSKLDFFIKQYRCYVDEGEINYELIDIDTRPISYKSIPSLLSKKYFYEKGDSLTLFKNVFYSDQSGLFYLPGFENKYQCFFDLLNNENIKLEDYQYDHQKNDITYLINEGYLELDKEGYIRIKDMFLMFLVGEIYREGTLNYHSYTKEIRDKIDEMEASILLFSESKLLSKQESDYFDYYLNNSKFRNGPAIRNKNAHGYKYESQEKAGSDYLISLKIVILLLLKIEHEIFLNSK